MRKTSLVLAALLAVAGICVMLCPTFTGSRLESHAEEAAQTFLEERKPEQQYPELLAALQEYNRQLYAEKQCNLVDLEACETPAADLTAYGIEDKIIGVTAKTVEQALKAQAHGADYLGVGAVFGTTSKADATKLDHKVLKEICETVDIPVVAIGGITEENVTELAGNGICGVAVISAVFGQPDIEQATKELKEKVEGMLK